MGNCLVHQERVIKIMKLDGKILEHKSPLQVHRVLSEFPGHAIADALPVTRHLPPHATMEGGHLYFLLPLPPPPPLLPVDDRDSKVSAMVVEEDGSHGSSRVVRIKLVVTKKELREMLRKGGVSADEMIASVMKRPEAADSAEDHASDGYRGWKPILESIPEGTDSS
ncbi:hypothetical protein ACLOJK_005874 [Asimina triloba]